MAAPTLDKWHQSGTKKQALPTAASLQKSSSQGASLASQASASQSGLSDGGELSNSDATNASPSRSQGSELGPAVPANYNFTMRQGGLQDGTRWMTDQPAVRTAPGVGVSARSSGGGVVRTAAGSSRSTRLVSRAVALQSAEEQSARSRQSQAAGAGAKASPSKAGGQRSGTSSPAKDSSVTCLVCHFTALGRPGPRARNAGQLRLSRAARNSLGGFKSVRLGLSASTKTERKVPLHENCLKSCTNMGVKLDADGIPTHVLRTLKKIRDMKCSRCGCPGATVTAAGDMHTEEALQSSPRGSAPKMYHVPCAVELRVAEAALFGSAGRVGAGAGAGGSPPPSPHSSSSSVRSGTDLARSALASGGSLNTSMSSANSAGSDAAARQLFRSNSAGGVGQAVTSKSALASVAPTDDSPAAWLARSKLAERKRAAQHAAGRSATDALLQQDGPALELNRALKARIAAKKEIETALELEMDDYLASVSDYLADSGVQAALEVLKGVLQQLPLERAKRVLAAARPSSAIKMLSMSSGSVGALSATTGLPQMDTMKLLSLRSSLDRPAGSIAEADKPRVPVIPERAYENGTVKRPAHGIDLLSFPLKAVPKALLEQAMVAATSLLQQLYKSAGLKPRSQSQGACEPAQAAAPPSPSVQGGVGAAAAAVAASPALSTPARSQGAQTDVEDTPVRAQEMPAASTGGVGQWATPARGPTATGSVAPLSPSLQSLAQQAAQPVVVLNSARYPAPQSPEAPLSTSQSAIAQEHGLFLNEECTSAALLGGDLKPPPPGRILPPAKVVAPSDSEVATMPMVEELSRLLLLLHPADARFPLSKACTDPPAARFQTLLTASSYAALALCSAMQHATVAAAHPDDPQTAHAMHNCRIPTSRSRFGPGPDCLPNERALIDAIQGMYARSVFMCEAGGAPDTPPVEVAATEGMVFSWERCITAARRNGLGPLGTALTSVSASSVAEFAEADSPSRGSRSPVSTPGSSARKRRRQSRISTAYAADGSLVVTSSAPSDTQGSGSGSTSPRAGGALQLSAVSSLSPGASATSAEGGGSSAPPPSSQEAGLHNYECWQDAAQEVSLCASLVDAWAAWVPLDCAVNPDLRQHVPSTCQLPDATQHVLEDIPTGPHTAAVRMAVLAEGCAPGVHQGALKYLLCQWAADTSSAAVASGQQKGTAPVQDSEPQRIPPMSDVQQLAALTMTDAAAERVEGARLAKGGGGIGVPRRGRESGARKRQREARNNVVHRPVAREAFALEHVLAPTSALGAYVVGRDLRRLLQDWSTLSTGACMALRQLIVDMHTLGKQPYVAVFRAATKLVRYAPTPLALEVSHRLLHGSASLFPAYITHSKAVVGSAGTPMAMVFDMIMPVVPHLVFPEVFVVGNAPPPPASEGGCPGQAPIVLVDIDAAPAPHARLLDASHPSSALLGLGDCSTHKLDLAVGRVSFAAWGAGALLRDANFWSEQLHECAKRVIVEFELRLDRLVDTLRGTSGYSSGKAFEDATWMVVPPWAPHTRMHKAMRTGDARMWASLLGDDCDNDSEQASAQVFGAFEEAPFAERLGATTWHGTYTCMHIQATAASMVDMVCSVFREHAVPRWAPCPSSDPRGAALWERLRHLSEQSMRVAGQWLGAMGMTVPLSRTFVRAVARSIRGLPSERHENMLFSAWPQCPMKRAVLAALQAPPTVVTDSPPPFSTAAGTGSAGSVVDLAESQDDEVGFGAPSPAGSPLSTGTEAAWESVAKAADECNNIVSAHGLHWAKMLSVVLKETRSL